MPEKCSTIVLLDKDLTTLKLYQRELSPEFKVITAQTVEEVYDLFQGHQFDILVIEPNGLGKKGWNLIDLIKLDPAKASLPIVICTTQNIDRGMLERDVTAYLVKPVIPMDLHELIRQILSQIQNPSFNLEIGENKRRQLK